MGDSFTEVTHASFGKRFVGSLSGFIIGPILFLISFGVLYWNEGRVDVSKIAVEAKQVSSPEEVVAGDLVSVSGQLTAANLLGDDRYLVPGSFAAVTRQVEMYQWEEQTSSQTTNNVGGSSDTETTYEYVKEWSDVINDSSRFKIAEGHQNPTEMTLIGETVVAPDLKIGNFAVGSSALSLPAMQPVTLDSSTVVVSGNESVQNGSYVYVPTEGQGDFTQPIVGDLRVSYQALPAGISGTLFGQANGTTVDPYIGDNNVRLFRLFTGSHDEAIRLMAGEYSASIWVLRVVGLLLMWIGMMLFINPLITLFNVLPVLGRLSSSVIGLASAVLALILTTITVLISMALHSMLGLILSLVIGLVLVGFYFKRLKTKEPTPAAAV